MCVPLEKSWLGPSIWLLIHKKKCFTFEKIKENSHNKKQTKNCTQQNDQFLSTVTWWLKIHGAVADWRSRETCSRNRTQVRDEWSRMKCSRSNNTERSEQMEWVLYPLWMAIHYQPQNSNQFHNSWKHCLSCFSSAELTPLHEKIRLVFNCQGTLVAWDGDHGENGHVLQYKA